MDEPEWLGEMRAMAEQVMAAAGRHITASAAQAEGLAAEVRIRVAQLKCVRCYGDPDVPASEWFASLGQGACSCPEPCPRSCCQAPDLLDDLAAL